MKSKFFLFAITIIFTLSIYKVQAKDQGSAFKNIFKPNRMKSELLNFSHLDLLEFTFKVPQVKNPQNKKNKNKDIFKDNNRKTLTSWAIYAEPVDHKNPDGKYKPVEAPGEGYACVDDVARIAILYLDHYEKYRNPVSLEKARDALDFLLYMHDGNGDFYNFIDKSGKINKEGHTSKAGLDWWTARAFWAMGKGIRIFRKNDPQYSQKLEKVFLKTFTKLEDYLMNSKLNPKIADQYKLRNINRGTLINDSGAITSIYVLGMVEYYKFRQSPQIKKIMEAFCYSLTRLEERREDSYPLKGFHYPTIWNTQMVHLYGNRQVMALAEAGKLLGIKEWVESAEREVNNAYPMLLTSWGVPFALSPGPETYPQIAYSVETVVSNTMAVYRATGREKYAAMAGLFASWFFGDNPKKEVVFLAYKGRCFDGIDKNGINKNAGAESTIEALLTMNELIGTPAENYLNLIQVSYYNRIPLIIPCKELRVKSGEVKRIERKYEGGSKDVILQLNNLAQLTRNIRVQFPEEYHAYIVYQKEGLKGTVPLKVKIAQRDKTVHLSGSDASYIYQCKSLGRFNLRKKSIVPLEISLEEKNQGVKLDSVIFQPSLQYRVWKRGTHGFFNAINLEPPGKKVRFENKASFNTRSEVIDTENKKDGNFSYIIMIYNTSNREQVIPVDFRKLEQSTGKSFYTGDDVMKIILPAYGWVMFKL